MSKSKRIGNSGYISSDSDDVCFLGEVTAESKRVTPLTISDSSSDDEAKFRNKRIKLDKDSDDSSVEDSRRKQCRTKKNPEKTHTEKEFVIDRTRAHSSFAHDFHQCEVCDVFFNTYDKYLMHLEDRRHRKAAKSMEIRMRSTSENYHDVNGNEDVSGKSRNGRYRGYPPVPTGVTRRTVRDESAIQSRIRNGFPPCPGLEHITEIRGLRDTSYFCGMCNVTCSVSSILNHLKDPKHQTRTLKSLDPSMYSILCKQPKSMRKRILVDMLRTIQEKDGSGRIVVEKDYLDEDRQRGNGFVETLDIPGTSSSNRGVPLYEVTHGMPFHEKTDNQDRQILSDKSKINYFCPKCECNMFDEVMWKSHSKRNPSLKGLRKYPEGTNSKAEHKPGTVAFLLDRLCDQDDPIVGLDFVREFQLEDKKETYHCIICGDCLNCINITDHVSSLNHRLKYIEHINHPSFDYIKTLNRRDNKTFYKVEEICRTIQNEIGRGTPQVYIIENKKDS